MSFQMFLLSISLAILGQTLAQTTTRWDYTEPETTWLPESTTPPQTEEPITDTTWIPESTPPPQSEESMTDATWIPESTSPPEQTEEPETSTVTQEPSVTSTASSSLNCGGISGGVVMHPSECNKIVFCHQNYGWEVECPQGEIFSWKTLTCGTDNSCTEYFKGHGNHNSLESEACKRQSQTFAEHPYEYNKYVYCKKLTTFFCASNQIFRWKYQRCLPGSQATNQLQSVSANCGFWGERAHPYLCEQYFQCRVWVSSLKTCPNGSIYYAPWKSCRRGNFQTCQYD